MKIGKMIGKITFIFCIKSVECIAKNYAFFYFINKNSLVVYLFLLWILTGMIKFLKNYRNKKKGITSFWLKLDFIFGRNHTKRGKETHLSYCSCSN